MGAPGCLYGAGVPQTKLAEIAARYGFDVAAEGAPPKAANGTAAVLVLDPVEPQVLNSALTAPYSAYIELNDEAAPINDITMDGLKQGKLCFSLATNTAYAMDSAAMVCDALSARGILSPVRRQDVELSLHETISNAVVHGNLGLQSAKKSNAADFGAFAQALQSRMQTPEARRRIDIVAGWDSEFLDITVADKGSGYNEADLPAADPFAPAGRGLAIIRSLTLAMNVTEGGRVITLRFLT